MKFQLVGIQTTFPFNAIQSDGRESSVLSQWTPASESHGLPTEGSCRGSRSPEPRTAIHLYAFGTASRAKRSSGDLFTKWQLHRVFYRPYTNPETDATDAETSSLFR
ncbi:hypothetical protein CEXT_681331 [Caerostris extrusa]|uniref:Uncharacterized protein n=1 Tax=Caerostris extrusa TaxID=172846 RepID=A0AAV4RF79_CAEEX|nr:hypothetical protein CEXT_681331 [Caerostris extrusa]